MAIIIFHARMPLMGKKIFQVIVYIFAGIGLFMMLGFLAIKLGLTNVSGIIDKQHDYFQQGTSQSSWQQSEEWATLQTAITKDNSDITKAAAVANIKPRLLVAPLVVEQLRLFTSEREIYKQIFEPLTMLGVQSQYSWGIMGIKEETAKTIEQNLKDTTSPYYLGASYEHLLDFTSTSTDANTERFNRLTDDKSRYYSYLYAALYEKEIITQWNKAGIDITNRPEIIATLFNIGFTHSKPNQDPQVGGAEIVIGNETYSFGGLAGEFYASNELPQFAK